MMNQAPAVFRYPGPTLRLVWSGRPEDEDLQSNPAADAAAVTAALALPSSLVRPLVCELATSTVVGPDLGSEEVVRRQAWRISGAGAASLDPGLAFGNANERTVTDLNSVVLSHWFDEVLADASQGGRAIWTEFVITACAARLPVEIGSAIGETLVLSDDGFEIEASVIHDDLGAWAAAQRYPSERPPLRLRFTTTQGVLSLEIEISWDAWWDGDRPNADLSAWLADLAKLQWS